ncbi:DUF447 domain-containing protein [Thermogladius sp. 4427co]|uniref:DUF447 domain-containing protein n=1 Tax=Thermogladius sp. 4427co TaxID=3450718 RepID=UPI003F7ADB35
MIRVRNNIVYESIATTLVDNYVYYTPLGFRPDGFKLYAKLYPETRLFRYIDRVGVVVLNIVRDPFYFIASSFKDYIGWKPEFVKSECTGFPRLRDTEAYIEAVVTNVADKESLRIISLEPVCVGLGGFITPFSRADAMLVESAVYATKILALKNKEPGLVSEFLEMFNYTARVLARVGDNPFYKMMLELLEKRVFQ